MILSTSPVSVVTAFEPSPQQPLSIEEFLCRLPSVIAEYDLQKTDNMPSSSTKELKDDPIMELFKRLDMTQSDWWRSYSHFDTSRHYTRNLIATDGSTYTLLLLCWNPGRESPIHNHPCKGCWMRVVEGCVQEQRYVENEKFSSADDVVDDESRLTRISSVVYHEGQATFVEDSMGYHKVGNPTLQQPAVTLHLYCPPFAHCKVWLGMNEEAQEGCVTHYSEYGRILLE